MPSVNVQPEVLEAENARLRAELDAAGRELAEAAHANGWIMCPGHRHG